MTTINIKDFSGSPLEIIRVPVVVDQVRTGISGFLFSASIQPAGVAKFIAVSYPNYGLTLTGELTDTSIGRISAVDLNELAETPTVDFQLFEFEIQILSQKSATLNLSIQQFDDDKGDSIPIDISQGRINAARFDIYPKIVAILETTEGERVIIAALDAFYADAQTRLRSIIDAIPNTTISRWHYHKSDGSVDEVEL